MNSLKPTSSLTAFDKMIANCFFAESTADVLLLFTSFPGPSFFSSFLQENITAKNIQNKKGMKAFFFIEIGIYIFGIAYSFKDFRLPLRFLYEAG
ncbi:hypothetical protein D3C86_1767600 [compost metagenome]